MGENRPVIEFNRLTKRFGGVMAVEEATFTVLPGRVVGLLGRNGAGKTTLLRSLLGLTAPTSGRALLWGRTFTELPRASHRVGVVTDTMRAVPGATGRRELAIWASALGLPSRRASEVLDLVGLAEAADVQVRTYSTGMRQRLSLATALLADPQLLILDEPTNGLDPEGVRWLRQLVQEFARSGRTVLLSSHQLAEVQRTVDDVVILQGKVLFSGPISELPGDQQLEDHFFHVVGQNEGSTHVR